MPYFYKKDIAKQACGRAFRMTGENIGDGCSVKCLLEMTWKLTESELSTTRTRIAVLFDAKYPFSTSENVHALSFKKGS